jgi:hypothetical protein
MKNFYFVFIICLLPVAGLFGQTESDINLVKYSHDFRFTDGIFMSFEEFKNNAPSIRKFEVIKNNYSYDESYMVLKAMQTDSLGNAKNKTVINCFGFAKNGVLYFSEGDNSYFRMFIVGALSHFLHYPQIKLFGDNYYVNSLTATKSVSDLRVYLLDFETGDSFIFNYPNFKDFLKTHDAELLNELEHSKNKRDMIHHFLLKYNEKHPIYFPDR